MVYSNIDLSSHSFDIWSTQISLLNQSHLEFEYSPRSLSAQVFFLTHHRIFGIFFIFCNNMLNLTLSPVDRFLGIFADGLWSFYRARSARGAPLAWWHISVLRDNAILHSSSSPSKLARYKPLASLRVRHSSLTSSYLSQLLHVLEAARGYKHKHDPGARFVVRGWRWSTSCTQLSCTRAKMLTAAYMVSLQTRHVSRERPRPLFIANKCEINLWLLNKWNSCMKPVSEM